MRLPAFASILLLAGCAAAQPAVEARPGPVVPRAPAHHVDFPVDASPRPLVLLGPPVAVVSGFADDEEKTSALGGGYRLAVAPPPTPAPGPVALPDGVVALPLIGAAEAAAAMSGSGAGEPLALVRAEFGTAPFATDRGTLELPAWRFRTARGSVVARLALAPGAFWRFGQVPVSDLAGGAKVDGARLTLTLPAPPAPCPGDAPVVSEPTAVESRTEVVVGVRTAGEVGDCARTLELRMETHQVVLSAPLGNRLLVDERGGVIPATRD